MTPPPAIARAVRVYGRHDVRVDLVPVDGPGPGEVLLRVGAVGLCGSDLHWYEEAGIGDAVLSRPLILGHEIGAEIAAGPRDGQRVAVDPAWDCGRCEPCLRGRSNLCLSMRFAGHGTTDGALRGLMPWPERLVWAVPDSIPDDEVPLLEPLGVALHALDLADLKSGDRVGVYGCGPLGLLLVALLRSRGVETIAATDILAHRVAAAHAAGATEAFLVAGGDGAATRTESGSASTEASERSLARDFPVDVAFEVAGSDDALSDAIAAVGPGGQIVLVGIPPGDRTTFEAAAARRKELVFRECRRMMAADLPRAIDLVAGGSIDLSSLITSRYPISEAREAFASLADRRGLKVIVNPNAE